MHGETTGRVLSVKVPVVYKNHHVNKLGKEGAANSVMVGSIRTSVKNCEPMSQSGAI